MDTQSPYELARQAMLRQLAERGITSPRVLKALEQVPRERFVPRKIANLAYADRAVPIGCDQTISQPYIVALMTEALALAGNERVLEVGTGRGYQAAVLARLAAEVITIERHAELAERARQTLAELGCTNVAVLLGDGTQGCPDRAPFDAILVAAAAHDIPAALARQLVEGGKLVIPLGDSQAQTLTLLEKRAGVLMPRSLTNCRFVPLVAGES